jgi:hypothetical protein
MFLSSDGDMEMLNKTVRRLEKLAGIQEFIRLLHLDALPNVVGVIPHTIQLSAKVHEPTNKMREEKRRPFPHQDVAYLAYYCRRKR